MVAAVICDGNRIFATQRGYGEWKDWWEFPGGKMEPGETPEAALQREIREELATDISVESLLTTVCYDYPNFHLTMHCYLCKVKSGNLTLLEHEAAKWLTRDELGCYGDFDSFEFMPPDNTDIKHDKTSLYFCVPPKSSIFGIQMKSRQ